MNTLIIQDAFEPYYDGRAGHTAPDPAKLRKKRKKQVEADTGGRKKEPVEPRREPVPQP